MFGLGTQELIIIFLIILVLFGASRLPELGKGIGSAIKNFKKAASGQDDDTTGKSEKKTEEPK